MQEYFFLNDTPEVSARTLWEAHKMCNQGQIALSASCKKIRQKLMADRLNKIKILKEVQKQTKATATLADFTKTLLLEELGKRYKKTFNSIKLFASKGISVASYWEGVSDSNRLLL